MLARLQRAITLGSLLLAALWAWVWTNSGHPAWGAAGSAILVGGYALVLALEFALLNRAHGDDPTLRATPMQLLRAWWGEVRAAPAVFCWRQPFRSQRWPDLLPPEAQGRRGVLLLHGYVCNRGVWNPWLERFHAQGVPVVAVNLEPVFGSIDCYVEIVEQAVCRLERATGEPPVIVAHSMGGLALRRWWAEHGKDERVHHAVTIGTPHQGTWLAHFAMTHNGRQMRKLSRWLQALVAREPLRRAARYTCYYSNCDNIVFPPAAGTLTGADNRHLPGMAHLQMLDCPEPWQHVQRLLARSCN
jgi:triacylglycerol esterase/lipase EstA (alpha/beta hydrolase family)